MFALHESTEHASKVGHIGVERTHALGSDVVSPSSGQEGITIDRVARAQRKHCEYRALLRTPQIDRSTSALGADRPEQTDRHLIRRRVHDVSP